jgi:hypothetical protein
MPLLKSSLASALEDVFNQKPAASPDAAEAWAQAYVSYASTAMATAGSLPVTAMTGLSMLTGVFTAAFNTVASQAAAAVMAQGITSFWQAIVWTGPAAAGTTIVPGNFALASALAAIFSDLGKKSAADKASEIADAFDAGAKLVMVSEIPFAPGPPIVGPIQ